MKVVEDWRLEVEAGVGTHPNTSEDHYWSTHRWLVLFIIAIELSMVNILSVAIADEYCY